MIPFFQSSLYQSEVYLNCKKITNHNYFIYFIEISDLFCSHLKNSHSNRRYKASHPVAKSNEESGSGGGKSSSKKLKDKFAAAGWSTNSSSLNEDDGPSISLREDNGVYNLTQVVVFSFSS
jgi:hypothetical protein